MPEAARRLIEGLKRHYISALLCLFAAVLIGGIWSVTLDQLADAKRRFLQTGEHDAASFARVFQEHTDRTIESADQAVEFLAYEYLRKGARLNIAELVESGVILGDIFNLFTIVAPDGDVILSNKPFTPVNLADREHIRVHREGMARGLFVSKPVLGRVSGKWSIQLTRRISNPDGSLGGVVVVSMDPFYFTRLYEATQISEHSAVTLVGDDGIVRARRTGDKSEVGQDISGAEVFRKLRASPQGSFTTRSRIDGRERVYAYRKLATYPLIVLVGMDVEDLLQPYVPIRDHAVRQAALSTLAIVAFTVFLIILVRRLQKSREQAIHANEAKTQFLSNMSHELRTPLNGILGYAELLRDELPEGEQKSFAHCIHDSGTHLLSLVNSILQLNKIEAGQTDVNIGEENLRSLVERTVNAHRSSAMAKGLVLDLALDPGAPATFWCDGTKVMQVLHNLLHNAIKFTDSGSVRLEVEPRGDAILFSVSDTGPGIPAGMQAAVFDQFFQVDAGNSRANEGTGLGLAIVRELVLLMGGSVDVSSEAGKGTTFVVVLPPGKPRADGDRLQTKVSIAT